MENPKSGDFGKALSRLSRDQSQDCGRHLAADHPIDRGGLTLAQLDFGRARRYDRSSHTAVVGGIPIVDGNRLAR